MPSITGIELGPDSCVLVSARPAEDAAEVSALHLIERAEWPQHDLAQTTTVRAIRRGKRLPRRACVVAWGLAEPAPANAPHVRSLLKPIIAAGFRVEKVMTPPQALAALSRTRPRMHGTAVGWLTLNVHGAAIAIVRDGELLFSRTFEWTYLGGVLGTRAELLQRYSLVSHLAPELRRGMMSVRSTHGAIVETVITCGDLPDLRSLTMPLIEELDLEVETLDSTEGLLSAATARNDRFAESAPALRLAVAAATSGAAPRRRGRRAMPPVLKPAAVTVIVAALAWLGQRYWKVTEVHPVGERVSAATAAVQQTARKTPPVVQPQTRTMPAAPAPVASVPAAVPLAPTTLAPSSKPVEIVPAPPPRSLPVTPQTESAVPPAKPPASPPVPAQTSNPAAQPTPIPPPAAPLKEAVPSLDSILIAKDRRVALLGGAIVSVGDSVGSRVVSQIDRDSVVLKEPSGYEIRVRLRQGPTQ